MLINDFPHEMGFTADYHRFRLPDLDQFQGFPELTWHIHQASRSGGCQSGKHENVKRRFAATIICGMGLFNDIHSCFPVFQIQNDSPLCVMFLAI